MVVPCAVPGCLDTKSHRHRFPNPKDRERFNAWLRLVGNKLLRTHDPQRVFNNYRVCHQHFTREDISSNMYLKKTTVPSQMLPKLTGEPCNVQQPRNTEKSGSVQPDGTHRENTLLGSDVPEAKNVHEEELSLLNHKVPSYVIHDSESDSTPHFDEELHSTENTQNVLLEKFDKICRICFSKNKLEPFFLLQFEERFLHDIYTKLTSLAAHVDDKLPSYICVDCIETIVNISVFIKKCQKSYELLQEVVSNGSNELFDIFVNENNKEKPSLVVQADIAIVSENSPDEIPGGTDSFPITRNTSSKEEPEKNSLISQHPKFPCKTCPCTFASALRLHDHMSRSIKCRYRNQECIVCKNRFSSLSKLQRHMRVHPNVKPYQCDICCQQYRTLRTLRLHQKVHEKRAQQRLLREKIAQQNENMQSCNICNKDITSGDMEQHMESHLSVVDINTLPIPTYCHKSEGVEDGTRRWLCSQCPKTFKMKSQLYFHEQDHAEGKLIDVNKYLCTVCGRLLESSHSFRYHMKSHVHPGKMFPCNVCKKKFVSSANLSNHMNIHNGIKRYLCSTCGKTFMQKNHLYVHSQTHVDLKPFSCHLCSKRFRHQVYLKLHLRVCTKMNSLISEEGPPYSCKTCAREFDTVKELHVHVLQNRKCRPKMHQCDLCKARFSTSYKLKQHIRAHSREKPYQCDICCEQFRFVGNLRRHEKMHKKRAQQRLLREKISQQSENLDPCSVSNAFTSFRDKKQPIESPVNDMMYQCKQDNISTDIQENNLYDSPENGRTSAKQWQCSQCPKTFKYKSKLYFHEQDHDQEKHSGYPCTLCGKVFQYLSVFQKHMKSHTASKIKPVCELCNKEFTTSAGLHLHMKIHSQIREFVCTICGKAFVQKSHLLTHSKIHADLKPFSCHICNNKFRDKGNLTQHLRTCSGITPFRCSFCGKGLSSSTSLRKHMETHQK